MTTRRELAEQRARQAHAERCAQLEGHKIAPWEGLSEMMREALIAAELSKITNRGNID
jgi:hypothetical protein